VSHITAKKVTRFFAHGRGFANKTLAYRFLAKAEIASEVWAAVYKMPPIEGSELEESMEHDARYRFAMKEKYPHIREGGGCDFVSVGGARRTCWRNHPTLIWCHAAYMKDLKNRIERMRKEDEVKP